jgi:hypothetical protein
MEVVSLLLDCSWTSLVAGMEMLGHGILGGRGWKPLEKENRDLVLRSSRLVE